MARGRGSARPKARHASVKRLTSSAFMGLPCPRNAAGIRGGDMLQVYHAQITRAVRSGGRAGSVVGPGRILVLHEQRVAIADDLAARVRGRGDRYELGAVERLGAGAAGRRRATQEGAGESAAAD